MSPSQKDFLTCVPLDISYCDYFDVWCLDRISGEYADTLEYLNISGQLVGGIYSIVRNICSLLFTLYSVVLDVDLHHIHNNPPPPPPPPSSIFLIQRQNFSCKLQGRGLVPVLMPFLDFDLKFQSKITSKTWFVNL